jgi:hypothetical protein
MALRFDSGFLTQDPYLTEDGTLLCEAAFARDGVLEYKDASTGEVRRELRLPEENRKAIAGFGLSPLTDEHPSELVTKDNSESLRKGITLQNPRYVVIPGKGGYVTGQVAVFDSALADEVMRGDRRELSAGYKCRVEEVPGVWTAPDGRQLKYDAIQRDLEINHVALTRWGRAGPDVGIRLKHDSQDTDVAYQLTHFDNGQEALQKMDTAQLQIPGGSIPVPKDVFNAVAPHIARLDSLDKSNSSLTARLDAIKEEKQRLDESLCKCHEKVKSTEDQVDYQAGRVDGLLERLTQAESALAQIGYRRRGDSYVLQEDEEDYMEDEEDYMEDEEEGDEGDTYASSEPWEEDEEFTGDALSYARAFHRQLRRADALVPGFSSIHLDAIDSIAAIRRMVVAEMRPELASRLDAADDSYVKAAYDLLDCEGEDCPDSGLDSEENEEESSRGDSASSDFSRMIAGRGGSAGGPMSSAERRMNRHKEPLTASVQPGQ